MDELDSSLHPLFVRALVEIFHNTEINRNKAQFIFNIHDTTRSTQQFSDAIPYISALAFLYRQEKPGKSPGRNVRKLIERAGL